MVHGGRVEWLCLQAPAWRPPIPEDMRTVQTEVPMDTELDALLKDLEAGSREDPLFNFTPAPLTVYHPEGWSNHNLHHTMLTPDVCIIKTPHDYFVQHPDDWKKLANGLPGYGEMPNLTEGVRFAGQQVLALFELHGCLNKWIHGR